MDDGELSLDSAPLRRQDVTGVELEGEMVLYAGDPGVVHKLDPHGTAVWRCLDGTVTLRELVAELAEVFEGDGDRIATDVLDYVRSLWRQGLLERVEPTTGI